MKPIAQAQLAVARLAASVASPASSNDLNPGSLAAQPDTTFVVAELVTLCRHIVCYIDGDQNGLPFSIAIGQATLSQHPEPLALQFEKFLDTQAIAKPMAGLIDLTAPLDLFGFTPPKDNAGLLDIVWPWSDLYRTALLHAPHIGRLRFDQYDRPLPNLCVKQLYIAQRRTPLWHDTKAFAGWVLGNWRRWDVKQSPSMG